MINNLKNITEDIVVESLNNTLKLRFDICTCPICKSDMLTYILSRIPPKYIYVSEDMTEEKLNEVFWQEKVKNQTAITANIIEAIEKVSANPNHKMSDDKKQSFELLLDMIHKERGLDFRHYRQELLKRRLALRINANNLKSYSEYINLLNNKPEEYDKLFEILCINVSEFFRDSEVWITVKYLLESIIRNKIQNNDKSLRLWSAGCASGEEPYSLAITIKELLGENPGNFSVEIYGTDIDKRCLNDVLFAQYGKDQIKNVNTNYLAKYFTPLKDGNYKLKPEIIHMAQFKYLELTSDEFIKDVDVVFCRNVFIYLYRNLQRKILEKFHACLKPKGYLVMGKVEVIATEAKALFSEIDSEAHVYQKI